MTTAEHAEMIAYLADFIRRRIEAPKAAADEALRKAAEDEAARDDAVHEQVARAMTEFAAH